MSVEQDNLRVLTDHVLKLAAAQQTAADQITGANRAIGDTASRVSATHGAVCALTNLALSTADEARATAGTDLQKRSTDLSERLSTAASNYSDADYRAGRRIDQAGRM